MVSSGVVALELKPRKPQPVLKTANLGTLVLASRPLVRRWKRRITSARNMRDYCQFRWSHEVAIEDSGTFSDPGTNVSRMENSRRHAKPASRSSERSGQAFILRKATPR